MQASTNHQDQETVHSLGNDLTVRYHTLKRVDDHPELSHSPITLAFKDPGVFSLLMEHGFVDPSMHPGSLTAGLISILGRRVEEERRRIRNLNRMSDGQSWRAIFHWLGFANISTQQSRDKRDVIVQLIESLRGWQARERTRPLCNETAWA